MNLMFSVVKEEYGSSGGGASPAAAAAAAAAVVRPMEGLHDCGPPPFLTKVYDMVNDESCDHILSWNKEGQSFVVWDPHAFSTNLLPRYFKHNNFSSFIRQLNTYGFRKIDSNIWEFANEAFLKGQRHILKNIKRRKVVTHPPPQQEPNNPCVEVGRFGFDGEIERLQRDKHVLMMELVKLKQQQQNTRAYLKKMVLRLQRTEQKQQKTMNFLAKALQNPSFVQKLAQHNAKRELEEVINNKRTRPMIDQGAESSKKVEQFGDIYGVQVCELEELALEMQGIGRSKRVQDKESEEIMSEFDGGEKDFDDEFWDELFDEHFD